MQWICGWSGSRQGLSALARPLHSQPLHRLHGNAWNVGYQSSDLRTVHAPAQRTGLTVIGNCLATASELSRSLDDAVAQRWENLALWPGSYLTVVNRAGKTVVFGDLAGRLLVHYVQTDAGVWWSSAATPLASLVGDTVDAAKLVCGIATNGIPPYVGDTPFSTIKTVPPGCYLEIDSGRITVGKWYRSLSLDYTEAAERLKAQLEDAVDRRYPMTADLSGGLDSSSLVCVAARRQHPVDVLTQQDPGVVDGDQVYAQAVLSQYPNVKQHVLLGNDGDMHYAGLSDDLPSTDLPSLDVTAMVPLRGQIEWARAQGSQRHMNGEGGDILFAPQPYWLLDLYGSNRLQAIWQSIQWARQRNTSPFGIVTSLPIAQHVAYDGALQRVARQLRRGVRASPVDTVQLNPRVARANREANWLTTEWSQRLADVVEAFSMTVEPSLSAGSANDWLMVWQAGNNAAMTRNLAYGAGVSIEEPYYDGLVLQTCLSVPGHERSSIRRFKPLLKQAVPGLPPALLRRTGKDIPQGWVERTLAAHCATVSAWIDRSWLVQTGVLRADILQEQLYGLRLGLPVRQYALDQVLAAEVWLYNLDLNRTSWWRETSVR